MKNIGLFVTTVTLVILATTFVLATGSFATINDVAVNGVEDFGPNDTVAVFADETVSVRVVFTASENAEDVRVISRVLGEPGLSEASERFDVLSGNTYSRTMHVNLPADFNEDELENSYTLEVSLENNDQVADELGINLLVQRSSYGLEILSVESDSEAMAGETMIFDVVVRNSGRHQAEDNFVKVSVPSLGISKKVFVGDMPSTDSTDPDEFNSVNVQVALEIPSNAQEGLYTVEVEAFNDDSSVMDSRRVLVSGSTDGTNVFASTTSKRFAAGEDGTYTLTVVNSGNAIKVYELVLDSTAGLTVDSDESMIAVPAGTGKTVKLRATANEEGTYDFTVNLHSEGELVKSESFTAKVQGNATTENTAVLLTVILAIIFVVLLVVLIVLLTKKPEKSEEFGESYY